MALVAVGVAVGVFILFFAYRKMWHAPEPGQAFIVAGVGTHDPDTGARVGFKVVVGKGTLLIPGFQTCRRLSLVARVAEVHAACETSEGTKVRISGVVGFRVGDDVPSITEAARRFLDQQVMMDYKTRRLVAGRMRSAVRGLTDDDLRDRERLTDRVRTSSAARMGKLGLVIDSLQIKNIEQE